MRHAHSFKYAVLIPLCLAAIAPIATAFEGHLHAMTTRGNETNPILYTVGTNFLRVEMTATNWPNPVDIVDLKSGAVTLLFPHNRSFVRLKPAAESSPAPASAMPPMPLPPGGLPSGIGPQFSVTQGSGSAAIPARPSIPQTPGGFPPGVGSQPSAGPGFSGLAAMPMIPGEKGQLRATADKTNLLGLACERYELKRRGETLEVWATGQLFPYRAYVENQPHRFGPRRLEEQWPELLTTRKLFPLLVTLRSDSAERFRFEVKSISPDEIADPEGKLFQPPPNYREIEPLPF